MTYLRSELQTQRDDSVNSPLYPSRMPEVWPAEGDLQALMTLSIPLFVHARAVCNHVACRLSCQRSLEELLDKKRPFLSPILTASSQSVLNDFFCGDYTRCCDSLVYGFQVLVGTIGALKEPLSVANISTILNTDLEEDWKTLKFLHSVLVVPSDKNGHVLPFHTSFIDSLFDS